MSPGRWVRAWWAVCVVRGEGPCQRVWGRERFSLRPSRSPWWRPVWVRWPVVGSAWPWRARYRSRGAGTGDLLVGWVGVGCAWVWFGSRCAGVAGCEEAGVGG